MESNTVAIAALSLTGALATGFFALVKQQNKIHEKLSVVMERVAKSGEIQAEATEKGFNKLVEESKRGNDESKERNGHLGELIVQNGENTKKLADTATLKIITAIQTQTVDEQHIKRQTVDKEIVKRKEV